MPPLDVGYFLGRIPGCQTRPLRATLVRRVRWAALNKFVPAQFLYASGKPGRYNPAGVECLYMCEDDATARIEYEDALDPNLVSKQPVVEYWAQANLSFRPILDLLDAKTLRALGLTATTPADPDIRNVFVNWRKYQPAGTQALGAAIVQLGNIGGVRYPSAAARRRRRSGANVVLFRRCIAIPDSVTVIGPTGALDRWP